jgi:hypothetical protein
MADAIAGKPAPTGLVSCVENVFAIDPCGSGLARDEACTNTIYPELTTH